MAKYRRKPAVIEAEQWIGPCSSPMRGVYVDGNTDDPTNYYVVTIHGQKTPIAPGDWILPEPDGEHFYPCKPSVFEATYEPDDDAQA